MNFGAILAMIPPNVLTEADAAAIVEDINVLTYGIATQQAAIAKAVK